VTDLPQTLTGSHLWRAIGSVPKLQSCIEDLRRIAEAVGAQAARVVPSYTDHSIKHMDALWQIADQVFKPEEIEGFSAGEAFILGASFYVHDLGMALACTEEGRNSLMAAGRYEVVVKRIRSSKVFDTDRSAALALEIAAREAHADKARQLALEPIPGLGQYLIESSEMRDKWGTYIADVSASHHWSLPAVDSKLGMRGKVPDTIGGQVDLGFVACALRIIDYAHINSERAGHLDRLLRSAIDASSLVHWKSQEYITGPLRQGDLLVFGCTQAIKNVEGWWLFFETAAGLDNEIHAVGEYLTGRAASSKRFSLEGVKGVGSPQNFAACVPTEGFEPVDVRFRPDSMDRLVEILGGRTLYGEDIFAPVRELLQNARDAIYLQRAADKVAGGQPEPGEIVVSIGKDSGDRDQLVVSDSGVGMTPDIVTSYLLGIASDYWNSPHFFASYPGVLDAGFRPAGRFGIGFLSVFMVGDKVEVQTQRRGGSHLILTLSGVGKRGALFNNPPLGSAGTTIRIQMTKQDPTVYQTLDAVARARAPMLDIPIRVNVQTRSNTIAPGWWRTAPQNEFYDFVREWKETAWRGRRAARSDGPLLASIPPTYSWPISVVLSSSFDDIPVSLRWPGKQPELLGDQHRVLAIAGLGVVLLCSRGIAVETQAATGIVGMVDLDDLEPNAARSTALGSEGNEHLSVVARQLRPKVVEALNDLRHEDSIPNRFGFIARVGRTHGRDVLAETTLPWVTVIDRPGNSLLLSPQDLSTRLSNAAEVIVTFGTDPWRAFTVSQKRFPNATPDCLLIAVPPRKAIFPARAGELNRSSYL